MRRPARSILRTLATEKSQKTRREFPEHELRCENHFQRENKLYNLGRNRLFRNSATAECYGFQLCSGLRLEENGRSVEGVARNMLIQSTLTAISMNATRHFRTRDQPLNNYRQQLFPIFIVAQCGAIRAVPASCYSDSETLLCGIASDAKIKETIFKIKHIIRHQVWQIRGRRIYLRTVLIFFIQVFRSIIPAP